MNRKAIAFSLSTELSALTAYLGVAGRETQEVRRALERCNQIVQSLLALSDLELCGELHPRGTVVCVGRHGHGDRYGETRLHQNFNVVWETKEPEEPR